MLPTVTIGHLHDLQWSAMANNHDQFSTATVWRAAITELLPAFDRLEEVLDSEEKAKATRFHQQADQQRFVISKAVLRILLSSYLLIEPKEIQFKTDKNKKPQLENNFERELRFNISHSGNWILISISNQEIGIDVEEMNASFTYQNLLPFSFNHLEINFIENSKCPYQSFYQLWTRKESLLKATGKGLVDELSLVPSLIGVHQNPIELIGSTENWQILSFPVDENYTGSIAFWPIKTALAFFDFKL